MSSWLHLCTDASTANEDSRCLAIKAGRLVSASLSLLGCLLALLVIVVYKKFRFATQRLVLYLLLSCLFIALSSLHNIAGDSPACTAKGFFRNYFGLTQNLWIICIDVHLLILLRTQHTYRHTERVFHGVVWGGALLLSLIPLFGGHYGHAGLWCWIKGGSDYENALRVLCYYFWLLLLVFGGGMIYGYIVYNILDKINSYDGPYNPDNERAKTQYKKNIRPLLLYPVVDLLLASVSTANRIQNWVNPGHPMFALSLLHAVVSPMWGFFNALLFLLNKETLTQLHPAVFWRELTQWTKTTFAVTRSGETREKNMEYTVRDEKGVSCREGGEEEESEEDMD